MFIESNNPDINVDKLLSLIHQELMNRKPSCLLQANIENTSEKKSIIMSDLNKIEVFLNTALLNSQVPSELPQRLNIFPFNISIIRKIILKIYWIVFKKQRVVDSNLILALREILQVNQELLARLEFTESRLNALDTNEANNLKSDIKSINLEIFIDSIYEVLLKRPADIDERNHYLNALKNGHSLQTILQSFLESSEFRKIYSPTASQSLTGLQNFEHKIYSQNGEDGIISLLLDYVGREHKYFVEFGVENGTECNTRYLREHAGFTGLMMDGSYENESIGLYKELVTQENINNLFEKYNVPYEFEILSIDVDGNDLWLWKQLSNVYRPKIVVIEYNAHLPPPISATIPYSENHRWDGTCFFGASLNALNIVAQEKGYSLIYCNKNGVNAFFLRNDFRDVFSKSFPISNIESIYVPADFGNTRYDINGYTLYGHQRLDQSTRKFVEYPSEIELFIKEINLK